MFCTKCGKQYDSGKFCVGCGAPLPQPAAPAAAPVATAAPAAPQQTVGGMNESFPCGLFQPPGVEVFGVTERGVVYGKSLFPFENIDSINKQTDSTGVTNGVYQMRTGGKLYLLVYKHADHDRALKALAYAQKRVGEHKEEEPAPTVGPDGLVYDLNGVRGRHIKIYEDRVVLSVKATIGSFITGNISDGEKTIYFEDCIGVQFKESGLQIGYLQFETAGRIMNNSASNFFNENTFTYDTTVQTNEFMVKVAAYVKDRVRACKQKPAAAAPAASGADELLKFKNLLDMGVITQEEFDKKKQQILGF